MSGGVETATADTMMCCASCGKAEVDEVKLKLCTACKLVKYCTVECQKNHRPKHKRSCKKRLAEIRDDRLFTQPDGSHFGECPICCLPLPLDTDKFRMMDCCTQTICAGCAYANQEREIDQGLEHKCTYCREPVSFTPEENYQNVMKRVKANDPNAIREAGKRCRDKGDYEGAFEYLSKAAELGDIDAHFNLSCMYRLGEGVEKDMKKEIYHLEEAAIGGHELARYNLGVRDWNNGRYERAMKHFIIVAKLGHDDALEQVKKGFQRGKVSKEDYALALRGHQAAVDATKSTQRDAAEKNLVFVKY